jgi:hypothetical protein
MANGSEPEVAPIFTPTDLDRKTQIFGREKLQFVHTLKRANIA